VPVFRGGSRVYEAPPLPEAAGRARRQLAAFDPSVRRFLNPHSYPVGLERSAHAVRTKLVVLARSLQRPERK